MSNMCPWCNIERKEFYIGGGIYEYKCGKCGGRMETNVR